MTTSKHNHDNSKLSKLIDTQHQLKFNTQNTQYTVYTQFFFIVFDRLGGIVLTLHLLLHLSLVHNYTTTQLHNDTTTQQHNYLLLHSYTSLHKKWRNNLCYSYSYSYSYSCAIAIAIAAAHYFSPTPPSLLLLPTIH